MFEDNLQNAVIMTSKRNADMLENIFTPQLSMR